MNSPSRKRPISRISTTTGTISLSLKLSPTQTSQRRPPPPPPSHKYRRTRLALIPPPTSPTDEFGFKEVDDPFSDDKCMVFEPIPSICEPMLSPVLASARMRELQSASCSESRSKLIADKILNRVGRRSMHHSIARRISLHQNGHFYVKSGLSNVLVTNGSDSEYSD